MSSTKLKALWADPKHRARRIVALRKAMREKYPPKHDIGKCACGCGERFDRFDSRGRSRKFIHGHNTEKKDYPDRKIHQMKSGYMAFGNNKYVHRHIIEKSIGRKLRHKEQVHHINHDKTDNRLENLMLVPNQKVHTSLHKELKQLWGHHKPRRQ